MYSDDDGIFLVKLARQTAEDFVQHQKKTEIPANTSDQLRVESGVFVTLKYLHGDKAVLRGCIGRPYPTLPLVEATIDAAVDSAVNDPRFSPVKPEELDTIIVELSVLTPPKKLEYSDPKELLNLIEIGRDGLIVSKGGQRGLLLPQVPMEWGWDVKEFLEHTCNKAWLPVNAWMDPKTEFHSFQAEIFGEVTPRGKIVRDPQHTQKN